MTRRSPLEEYWREHRLLIVVLLAIRALVSYVFAIFRTRLLYDV